MNHLKGLRAANLSMAAIDAIIGASALLTVAGVVAVTLSIGVGVDELLFVFPIFAWFLVFTVAWPAAFILCGRRVAEGRGAVLQTVLGLLNLVGFPGVLYTLYGLYVVWMNPGTRDLFAAGGVDDP